MQTTEPHLFTYQHRAQRHICHCYTKVGLQHSLCGSPTSTAPSDTSVTATPRWVYSTASVTHLPAPRPATHLSLLHQGGSTAQPLWLTYQHRAQRHICHCYTKVGLQHSLGDSPTSTASSDTSVTATPRWVYSTASVAHLPAPRPATHLSLLHQGGSTAQPLWLTITR